MRKILLRSPIVWYGGKYYQRKEIIPVLESIEHNVYVEGFGGSAILLLNKDVKDIEVYNDLNEDLYSLFLVLSDTKLFNQFKRRISVLPIHRKIFSDFKTSIVSDENLISRATKIFLVMRQAFSGNYHREQTSFSFSKSISRNKKPMIVNRWLSILDMLPEIHERLQRVQIENKDIIDLINTYDSEDVLFYLDPPYVHSTRKIKSNYMHEMSDEDHRSLVETLLKLKGKCVVSAYKHPIYDILIEHGWESQTYKKVKRATNSNNSDRIYAQETLYIKR